MRAAIVTLCCVFAVSAHAQDRIPDTELRQVYEQCVPTCEETRSYAFCSRVCACVADEMSRYWTAAEFQEKSGALSREADSGAVRAQFGRLAAFCADRAG